KSLPVPLYLPNRSSSIAEVLHQVALDRGSAALAGVEPQDPGITSEPRELAPSEGPGPLRRAGDRVLQRDGAIQVLDGLSVPDGLPCVEGRARSARHERPDLVQQTPFELRADAPLDPISKDRRREPHTGRSQA